MIDRKNVTTGLIFVGAGVAFALIAGRTLDIGSAAQMGPGFFPMAVGIVLMGLGTLIVISPPDQEQAADRPFPWRGIVLVCLAIGFASVAIDRIGLVPTTAGVVFLSCYASRQMTLKYAIPLTIALTLLSFLIFKIGLNLPLPAFSPWPWW